MRKIIKVLLIIIVIVVLTLVGAYAYYGGFGSVKFEVKEAGGETVVYEDMMGDYAQTPIVMDKVYHSLLKDFNVETTKGFGIYYDNPQTVEKHKLRSEVGCIIDGAIDSTKLAEISARFRVKTLPKGSCITTDFPHKGTMSEIVGVMKVYPALNDYVKANGYKEEGAITEIYDMSFKKITYRTEVVK